MHGFSEDGELVIDEDDCTDQSSDSEEELEGDSNHKENGAEIEAGIEVWLYFMKIISTEFTVYIKEIDANIRHEAVPVPIGQCPFDNDGLSLFEQGLKLLLDSNDLPPGYGVTITELRGKEFDEREDIQIGLQKKGFPIQLSSQIWKPRTDIWAQGLFVMNSFLGLSH